MRGFAMLEIGKTGWLEKPVPEYSPVDALLKPLAVACCTTDVKTIAGGLGERHNMILGHEAVAEIVAVGSMVKSFKPGDKVIVPAVTPEWGSIAAQEGFAQHCNGPLCGWRYSNYMDGVFCEYFNCNEADANLIKLPDNIDPADATMLSDIVPPGFTAADLADIKFGDTVLIIGIGAVGLMAVAACSMRGAARIIGVGRRQICKDAAKKYGADDIIDYTNGPVYEQVMALTDNKPVDRVCICGGGADTYATAIKCLKPGGKIGSIISLSNTDNVVMTGPELTSGMSNKQIIGAGMWTGRSFISRLTSLISSGKLDVKPLVTHKYHGWDQLEDALKTMTEKPDDLIKPVVIL